MKYKLSILILFFVVFNVYTQEKKPSLKITKNGKYALFSSEGKQLTDSVYDYGYCYTEVCKVKKNEKYGFINHKGVQIIPCKYQLAYRVTKGIVTVSNREERFYINEEGKEIKPYILYEIKIKSEERNKKQATEIKKGENSKLYYNYNTLPLDEYTISKQHKKNGTFEVIINGKREYINKKEVETKTHKYSFEYLRKGLVYGKKHLTKEEIEKLDKAKLSFSYHNKGVIDTLGNIVIPFKYDTIEILKNGFFKVEKRYNRKSKYAYFNAKGKQILPFKYAYASDFSPKGYALVKEKFNGDLFVIDTLGKVISKQKYDRMDSHIKNDLILVSLNGKSGFINIHNKLVIDFKFDSANRFNKGLALVSLYDKFGYINVKGEIVIPIKFDKADYYFTDEVEELERDGKKYYFDRTGKEIKNFKQ